MKAFLYGIALQWKLDIRSKTLLITCYIVPLLFFGVMGSIFTSVMPDSKETLIQSMTIFGVTMGALIGVPPSLAEIYSSDVKKIYRANGVPLYLGIVSIIISALSALPRRLRSTPGFRKIQGCILQDWLFSLLHPLPLQASSVWL